MAVNPVTLKVQDFVDREVIKLDYSFEQATDTEGQITGIPRGGKVTIRVKALNDGNNQLSQWMLNPTDPRDMTIEFNKTTDGSKMKEIKATGAYCINYKEDWQDGEQHYEEITIVCQTLDNGGVQYENPWK